MQKKITFLLMWIFSFMLPHSLHSQTVNLTSQNGKMDFCENDSLLLIANTNGWTGNLTYSWISDNNFMLASSDSFFFAKNTAVYKVKVTNGTFSLDSDTLRLTEHSESATIVIRDSINCAGGNNGSLAVNVINGSGSYNYIWTPDGGSDSLATNLFSGIYQCEISDLLFGCVMRVGEVLPEPSPIQINITAVTPSAGQGNGSATALVSGGTPPYFYTWNSLPTQYTPTATNLLAGNYTLNLQDSHGCTSIQQVNISLLGINSNLTKTNIILYPNPANDFLSLQNLPISTQKIRLYNEIGEKIWEGFPTENSLDIRELSNGIYRLMLISEEKTWASSFIIQR